MTILYKCFRGFHNAGQGQDLHLCRTRPFERLGAGVHGRPSGEDIVHQKHIVAGHPGGIGNPEGTPDIAPARPSRCHGALAFGGADTRQGVWRHRFAASRRQPPRQLRRLIVPSSPKPQPVQGHGHNQIGLGQKRLPAARQPLGKSRHQIQAVRMFESQDRSPALFVIGENGAGPIKRRWLGKAGAAARSRPRIEGERQAATFASRTIQEDNAAPANRTKALAHAKGFTAAQTVRRKQKVQQPGFHIQSHHP